MEVTIKTNNREHSWDITESVRTIKFLARITKCYIRAKLKVRKTRR